MAQTQFCLLQWGIELTVTDQCHPVDLKTLALIHRELSPAAVQPWGSSRSCVPDKVDSFPTSGKEILTRFVQRDTGVRQRLLCLLLDDVLCFLVALYDRRVVRRREGIQLRKLGRFRTVPRAVNLGQDSIRRRGDDAGLGEASERGSRHQF